MTMTFQSMDDQIALLRKQVVATESQLASLKAQLAQAESRAETARQLEAAYQGGFPPEWIGETLSALTDDLHGYDGTASSPSDLARDIRHDTGMEKEFVTPEPVSSRWPLAGEEYRRYGRQMIMNEVGLHGQLRLKNAKVLVVGCGGLGCPAAAYLAGAGVGTLGLMDGDIVEVSNLHRQIAHSTPRVGKSKVDSAWEYLHELNPLIKYERHPFHLSPSIALTIFSTYHLILDCTDHPTSRYLISDACVLTGKPLVSASALKTEGQLIVLNNPPRMPGNPTGGPCYRCIFPKPPPADSVLSCGEGGVLGPVVGTMGVLQALEAIKLITAGPQRNTSIDLDHIAESPRAQMLICSAFSTPQFRSVRMRGRHNTCAACSTQATITPDQLTDGSMDYAAFCGITNPITLLPPTSRVTAADFARMPRDGTNVLLDVRDETQYAICALRGSINVPWQGSADRWLEKVMHSGALMLAASGRQRDVFVVCRFGNDSQLAAKAVIDMMGALEEGGGPSGAGVNVRDIRGGFRAWREEVDGEWPDY
ncbi:Adenylyltransferase and sulfurtransferase uba4 [Fulvia fulva]|uniref:Adenylyltransferase and sulfurtransferase uba4 n=1 Tax=Passalora fulva TaxID=5499 RepID=A0A9Q8UTQ4_PASFU|nr:Adenylyltransferase and sulfurtransferase uba4 [Fulvia fulva]KAK4613689.1 Adenylyltransferase and sulfurtransferase uba4 [Fulvia fulva]KAK4614806.1 Adenylyltransferase and sulfurtransferase uba4 [Fulvia fulva]UJO22164.1 Adenylyltransferase and sulfurtransferase uba4 [Fulvia fulva]WPV20338.1 Adenylyltransferase and sulfurtransferase uba4 [Fulvia fulva]WPV35437.1 Adenylyltransferase and sulfurtransferase uba4 [Fulvia fulva]